jgi:LCP family protein required for cell wall assembly
VSTPPEGPPEYKVYRSRRRPLGNLRPSGDLDGLRKRLGRRREREPRERKGVSPGRVLKWVAFAVLGWILLSVAIFMISAQLQEGVSDSAERALSTEGNLLTGSTILVLGSDARTGESIDDSQSGAPRADTIMLMHAAFGGVRRLSIPRDTEAPIPGHGTQRINAAYAIGGPALMIETVESYLGNGLKVNHLIEVDFEDFPELIDALGGITVDVPRRICSPPFDNFWKGLNFRAGKQQLDGTRALGFARIRKNTCAASETDIDRAKRQQEVIAGIRRKTLSVPGFLRLPLASWRAPQAIKSDMKGPGLTALFADIASGGLGDTEVLEPSCLSCGVAGSLQVSEGARRDAVRKLLDG